MTGKRHQPGLLGRILGSFLDTSKAAVAIHYDAPWSRAQYVPIRGASLQPGRVA